MDNQASRAIIFHAQDCAKAAKKADEELTFSLLALIGCVLSHTDQDEIDLSDKEIFIDPSPHSTDEDKIHQITENEDGELVAMVEGNDDYEIAIGDLLLPVRIELVKVLSKIAGL